MPHISINGSQLSLVKCHGLPAVHRPSLGADGSRTTRTGHQYRPQVVGRWEQDHHLPKNGPFTDDTMRFLMHFDASNDTKIWGILWMILMIYLYSFKIPLWVFFARALKEDLPDHTARISAKYHEYRWVIVGNTNHPLIIPVSSL